MLGQIKDIVQEDDPNLYTLIHNCVCTWWNKLNVPLHALAYILMPNYYSPYWLGQPTPRGGVRIKPHTDPEVSKGYMEALDKLVPDKECANLRLELGRYFSCTDLFSSLHAMEDRDRFDALTWWEAYGGMGVLPTLTKKSSLAESVVYVHYNLRLLSHYCDWAYEDPTYKIWDNHPEDHDLEDGTIHLEELEAKLLRDDDDTTTTMPPPPSSSSVNARVPTSFPLFPPPPPSSSSVSARVSTSFPLPPPPPSTSSHGGHVPSGSSRATMRGDS
eukprot:PITA_36224